MNARKTEDIFLVSFLLFPVFSVSFVLPFSYSVFKKTSQSTNLPENKSMQLSSWLPNLQHWCEHVQGGGWCCWGAQPFLSKAVSFRFTQNAAACERTPMLECKYIFMQNLGLDGMAWLQGNGSRLAQLLVTVGLAGFFRAKLRIMTSIKIDSCSSGWLESET